MKTPAERMRPINGRNQWDGKGNKINKYTKRLCKHTDTANGRVCSFRLPFYLSVYLSVGFLLRVILCCMLCRSTEIYKLLSQTGQKHNESVWMWFMLIFPSIRLNYVRTRWPSPNTRLSTYPDVWKAWKWYILIAFSDYTNLRLLISATSWTLCVSPRTSLGIII
jgi:hypothetical protein